jgi:hypothetical protein
LPSSDWPHSVPLWQFEISALLASLQMGDYQRNHNKKKKQENNKKYIILFQYLCHKKYK